MLESRDLKRDLAALTLAAGAIFVSAAWITHDPADPPREIDYPARAEPVNLCGRAGCVVARAMIFGVGQVGCAYVVVSGIGLSLVMLGRCEITEPVGRCLGWLLSLVGLATLSALAVPQWSGSGLLGAGGYLGITFRGLLLMHFATIGAYIVSVLLAVVGLLLCTDYLLVRFLVWVCAAPARRASILACAAKPRSRRGRGTAAAATDDEVEDVVLDAEELPAIRIRRRQEGPPAEVEDEKEREQGREVPEDAEEAGTEDTSNMAARIANVFHIRRRARRADDPRNAVHQQLDAASMSQGTRDYALPPIDLLMHGETTDGAEHDKEVRRYARLLEKTFQNFGLAVHVVEIETGPVVSQYEVELEAGLRLSKVAGLADDLAIALRVPSVRIVAPIPGKNTVGIEIPNSTRQLVRLRDVIEHAAPEVAKYRIPIYLGKDVSGNPLVVDLTTLPHLLIAGRTGTGKSVCLNSIIVSMLMTRRPDEVRMLLIDPKMVELSPYKALPHLMHPVVTDMHKAEAILGWAVEKMEERYALLARAGVRHVAAYNQLGEEELLKRLSPESEEDRAHIPRQLPYIVLVADEMADLMMTAPKEVEHHIIRLAQKSRAVGIHLVLATQKPTVDVITGLIKSNLPARVSFQVASRVDSRVVLDENGADKLLGNGDMLFLYPGTNSLLRGQGTYVGDEEIAAVVEFVATDEPCFVKELVQLRPKIPASSGKELWNDRDELYSQAVEIVVREGRGSVSLLQRSLGIGYGRAARLIDYMSEDGVVGQYNGSQAREVLIDIGEWERMTARGASRDNGGRGEPSQYRPHAPPTRPAEPARDRKLSEPPPRDRRSAASLREGGPPVAGMDRRHAPGMEVDAPWNEEDEVEAEEGLEEEPLDAAECDDELTDDVEDESLDEPEEEEDAFDEEEGEEEEEPGDSDGASFDDMTDETREVEEQEEQDDEEEAFHTPVQDEMCEEVEDETKTGLDAPNKEKEDLPPFDPSNGPRIVRRDDRRDRLRTLQQQLNRFPKTNEDRHSRRFSRRR